MGAAEANPTQANPPPPKRLPSPPKLSEIRAV
jgi:hypothetical protein